MAVPTIVSFDMFPAKRMELVNMEIDCESNFF